MSANTSQKPRSLVPVKVNAAAVLKSWRESLLSFEWLDPQGNIRPPADMPVREAEKRAAAQKQIESGSYDLPVLGIGLQDNIEIGSGKAVFLTLAARGDREIDVLIPEKSQNDFSKFLA